MVLLTLPCCHTQAYDSKAYDSKESSIKNGKIVQKCCSLARRGQAEATTAAVRLVVTVAVILCCSSSSTRVKLAVMAVTLCTVGTIVISGRPAATPRPTDSYPVQIELDGRTQVLTVGSHWTARDVTAALEAKTGRSLRGCWLLAPGAKVLRVGKTPRTLGAAGVRKNSVLEVRHRRHGGAPPTSAELATAFKLFDSDGDGVLSAEELKAILCRPTPGGTPLTEQRVDEIMRKFDANNDGVLSVHELAAGWHELGLTKAVAAANATFEETTPMLVMPFEQFKAQGRIFKSTKAWREEAFEKEWLVKYDEGSGKVVIFVSHT